MKLNKELIEVEKEVIKSLEIGNESDENYIRELRENQYRGQVTEARIALLKKQIKVRERVIRIRQGIINTLCQK